MSTPPKYPSTPHWPDSETVHRDDTLHEAPHWFVGRPVVVTEKLDGGNTCLFKGDVYARSVAAPARDGWFAMVKKHHAWKTFNGSFALYGEDMYGIHSIEYDPIAEEETYRLFAVREVDGADYFLSWQSVEEIAVEYSMRTVPVLFRGVFHSVDDITAYFREELSKPSGLGGEREGFVMRLETGFPATMFREAVCKYVRPNHVQTDQHWRRNWKPCPLA